MKIMMLLALAFGVFIIYAAVVHIDLNMLYAALAGLSVFYAFCFLWLWRRNAAGGVLHDLWHLPNALRNKSDEGR